MIFQHVLLQTCVEAYRVPVFAGVAQRLESNFRVAAGLDYFTPALKTVAADEPWFLPFSNQFDEKRRFCYQHGWHRLLDVPGTLVAELNPRIISTWMLFAYRRALGRRSLFWGHVSGRGERGAAIKAIRAAQLRLSHGMITYTRADADSLRADGYPHPIWTASNSCVRASDCVPVRGGGNRVVYVGRLVKEKKPTLLLEGFTRAATTLDDLELHIVGEGPERKTLEERALQLPCAERIYFHGRVTAPEALREIYQEGLVAISPGYVGLSCIQAMAHGLPMLIARDEPHAPEIEVCREGIDTIFFDSNDPADMAHRLLGIASERDYWGSRSGELSRRIRDKYTTDAMAEVIAAAIQGDRI